MSALLTGMEVRTMNTAEENKTVNTQASLSPEKAAKLAKKRRLFNTPFHREYWKLAAQEFGNWKILVLAAMLTTLRIAVKSLRIPLGPDLNITFGFIVNAVGSMIYGPVVAIVASAISDTLGAILFPSGTYFFPLK